MRLLPVLLAAGLTAATAPAWAQSTPRPQQTPRATQAAVPTVAQPVRPATAQAPAAAPKGLLDAENLKTAAIGGAVVGAVALPVLYPVAMGAIYMAGSTLVSAGSAMMSTGAATNTAISGVGYVGQAAVGAVGGWWLGEYLFGQKTGQN